MLVDHVNSGRDGLTRAVAGKDTAFPGLALAVRLLFSRLLGARRERPRDRRAGDKRDELAPCRLIELRSIPSS
jgi:hypothetical protein